MLCILVYKQWVGLCAKGGGSLYWRDHQQHQMLRIRIVRFSGFPRKKALAETLESTVLLHHCTCLHITKCHHTSGQITIVSRLISFDW